MYGAINLSDTNLFDLCDHHLTHTICINKIKCHLIYSRWQLLNSYRLHSDAHARINIVHVGWTAEVNKACDHTLHIIWLEL